MNSILHLSDLHFSEGFVLGPPPSDDPDGRPRVDPQLIFGNLCAALRQEAQKPALVAITGDFYQSRAIPVGIAIEIFDKFWKGLCDACGSEPKLVLIPGNHDARKGGFFGTSNSRLFRKLREHVKQPRFHGMVRVYGAREPTLAEWVEPAFHELPVHMVAYDSTYLPRGLLGAGGVIRGEDLLSLAPALKDDRPLIFLVHHHLVPTPVADLTVVTAEGRLQSWIARGLAPRLVANADVEEMTMAALGAGTALSILQLLGRPVVVLHGHKHYPSTRLLLGMQSNQADVLVLAAGSAGIPEMVSPQNNDPVRIWPTFNRVELHPQGMCATMVSYPWKRVLDGPPLERPLVEAEWTGLRTRLTMGSEVPVPAGTGPDIETNIATFSLTPGSRLGRSSLSVLRTVTQPEVPRRTLRRPYRDQVEGAKGARITAISGGPNAGATLRCPHTVQLPLGEEISYSVRNAVYASLTELRRVLGLNRAPFAWVGLHNRYASNLVRMVLRGIPEGECFATITDLTMGRERPLDLTVTKEGSVVVEQAACAPRQLLKIYWRLPQE